MPPIAPAAPFGAAGAPHLAFEARESADPTTAGGDLPVAVYQTWVTGGRVQDSSSPQVMSLELSPAASAALAHAFVPTDGDAAGSSLDVAGGDLGSHFRVVLVRGDMRPVEAWDDVANTYAPLQIPQSTFSFSRSRGGAVAMEMRRKHLPPSKNHGDVFFRLIVQLRVDVLGARPVAVSSPFRIFSKQSTAAPRPEPKRRRNPAPTKPFVAPLDPESSDALAACLPCDAASVASSSSTAATAEVDRVASPPQARARPRITTMAPPAPRRSVRAAKRDRPEADEVAPERPRPPGPGMAWEQASAAAASVPRAGLGTGVFSFASIDEEDTASDAELSSLGREDSFGLGSQGHAEPSDDDDDYDDDEMHRVTAWAGRPGPLVFASPAVPAGCIAPLAPPPFQAAFARCLGEGLLTPGSRPRAVSIPCASPPTLAWANLE